MLGNESAGISTAIQPGPTANPVPQLIPIQCEVALDPDETNDSRPRLDGRAEDGIQEVALLRFGQMALRGGCKDGDYPYRFRHGRCRRRWGGGPTTSRPRRFSVHLGLRLTGPPSVLAIIVSLRLLRKVPAQRMVGRISHSPYGRTDAALR